MLQYQLIIKSVHCLLHLCSSTPPPPPCHCFWFCSHPQQAKRNLRDLWTDVCHYHRKHFFSTHCFTSWVFLFSLVIRTCSDVQCTSICSLQINVTTFAFIIYFGLFSPIFSITEGKTKGKEFIDKKEKYVHRAIWS